MSTTRPPWPRWSGWSRPVKPLRALRARSSPCRQDRRTAFSTKPAQTAGGQKRPRRKEKAVIGLRRRLPYRAERTGLFDPLLFNHPSAPGRGPPIVRKPLLINRFPTYLTRSGRDENESSAYCLYAPSVHHLCTTRQRPSSIHQPRATAIVATFWENSNASRGIQFRQLYETLFDRRK